MIAPSANGTVAQYTSSSQADSDYRTEVMQVFLETAPPVYDKLIRALQDEDWEQARANAHWLQGGATRMVNADLQQRLRSIELRCRESSPVVQADDLEALASAFHNAVITARACVQPPNAYSASI